jgi:hypothetical protein
MILSGGWTAVTGQLIDGDIFHCYIFVCFSHHRDPLFPSVRALDEDRMNRGEQAKINLEVFCLVDRIQQNPMIGLYINIHCTIRRTLFIIMNKIVQL